MRSASSHQSWAGRGKTISAMVTVRHAVASDAEALARAAEQTFRDTFSSDNNPEAIAFYGKCGFKTVGEQYFQLGKDLQRDLVMAAPVAELTI